MNKHMDLNKSQGFEAGKEISDFQSFTARQSDAGCGGGANAPQHPELATFPGHVVEVILVFCHPRQVLLER